MATIACFEDIEAWQKARILCQMIYKCTLRNEFTQDMALSYQIRRSSGSVMDNIAEGFNRGYGKEFRRFLYYSKGSIAEVRSQLYRALDQNFISHIEFDQCINLSTQIANLIGGMIRYLNKTDQN